MSDLKDKDFSFTLPLWKRKKLKKELKNLKNKLN